MPRLDAFEVLGDPVRRRILELPSDGERSSGAVCAVIGDEFAISQPAVSQHLRVLREAGLATVRPEGTRRMYAVGQRGFRDVDAWLDRFRLARAPRLDALAAEAARATRQDSQRYRRRLTARAGEPRRIEPGD